MTCKWCKRNNGACNTKELVKDCDFRTLPYERNAIIVRAKKELETVKQIREKLKDEKDAGVIQSMVVDASDRVAGIRIMLDALQEDFGVKDPEGVVGMPKVGMLDAMKLAIKLKQMEKTRGRLHGRS